MELFASNDTLTPHQVSLCILLNESLTNMNIWPSLRPAIHSFLLHSFLKAEDLPLAELLSRLSAIDRSTGPDSLSQVLKKNLEELSHFNELLSLFNVRLAELKTDGEINLGYLEEGGLLYLFLRKSFLVFSKLSFQALTELFDNIADYKAGLPVPPLTNPMTLGKLAAELPMLLVRLGKEELMSLLSLHKGSELLQALLQSHYREDQAVDSLHRFFDQNLDAHRPTRITKERGLVIVQSSTHYASLHRVKVEIELGHWEVAVNLLVETLKRALSESDEAVILESTLLFAQIAGHRGNAAQERSLVSKALSSALERKSVEGLSATTCQFAQLELLYGPQDRPDLISAVTVKPERPKNVLPIPLFLTPDPSALPSVALRDAALLEALNHFSFDSVRRAQMSIAAATWLNAGSHDMAAVQLQALAEVTMDRESANFYMLLARRLSVYSAQAVSRLLQYIDQSVPVKECTQWHSTLLFVQHTRALFMGEYVEAEAFEEELLKSDGETRLEATIMRSERCWQEGLLDQASRLALEALKEAGHRQHVVLELRVHIVLARIQASCQHYFAALIHAVKARKLARVHTHDLLLATTLVAELLLIVRQSAVPAILQLQDQSSRLYSAPVLHQGLYFSVLGQAQACLVHQLPSMADSLSRAALESWSKAIVAFTEVNSQWHLRETYYLVARLHDELGWFAGRDQAASEFQQCSQKLNWGRRRTVRLEVPLTVS
jgi:hypothetical protein